MTRALTLLVLSLLTCVAQAQGPLALSALRGELDLAANVELLRDPEGKRSFADVRDDAAFVRHDGSALSFGFDYDALWLRFAAYNDSARATRWLLEVAEPSLDHVDLYVVHADGRTEHFVGGDALPFASRAIRHVHTTFALEAPAYDQARYYLRVQSDDVLRAPLRAWSPDAYRRQHERDSLFVVLCVGALLLVAVYHLGVSWMVRQKENAWFSLVALALLSVLMSLGGQFGQLLFDESPRLANKLPSLSLALAMLTVAFFAHSTIDELGTLPKLTFMLWVVALSTVGLVGFAIVTPSGLGLRVLATILLLLALSGPYLLSLLPTYDIPELFWYRFAWYALILSIPVAVLRYAGIVPDNVVTLHTLPVGLVSYTIANTLALAALANRLRGEIATVNDRLVNNVEQLRQALERAEDANEAARRATKSKDEFVATMSHELRTPLNTIINIPQGLAAEFVRERAATCAHCATAYLLDEGDVIDGETLCEHCGERGKLVEGTKVRFRGDDARALRFLRKIERSGHHLLQLVNGVLDYSKLEAGRLQLALGQVDMSMLLREVMEQMNDPAQRQGVRLVLACQGAQTTVEADASRLKQVLLHLVSNAIKFSAPGSTVTVRWRSTEDGERVEVEDRGIGIALENHERIFTSFEQVHKGDTRKYGGTGLGLSIARSLARMHGGELSVHSELGKGSTFTVQLPRATSQSVRAS
ncbi:MAG: sensor histidine kinase [Polyangiales bacterium]